jgi:hypothetical protein
MKILGHTWVAFITISDQKYNSVANPMVIKHFACGDQKCGSMLYNNDGFQSPILQ